LNVAGGGTQSLHDLVATRHEGHRGSDEEQLTDFDADVEKEQRDGNRRLR